VTIRGSNRINRHDQTFLASSFVLGLTLSVTAPAVPLLDATQVPGGGLNPDAPPPGPQEKATKEVMPEPDGRAFCLALSPDEKTLAAGCTDHSIRLLDYVTGRRKNVLTGVPRGYIRGVAFTPDGKTIVGIGDDDDVQLWDAASEKVRKEFPALGDMKPAGLPPTWPHSMATSPDGARIAVGASGTVDRSGLVRLDENTFFAIRVLDAKTGERVSSHVGRRGYVHQFAFSPDGRTLAGDMTGEALFCCDSSATSRIDARTGQNRQDLMRVTAVQNN
jgi:WD40 repeat protein